MRANIAFIFFVVGVVLYSCQNNNRDQNNTNADTTQVSIASADTLTTDTLKKEANTTHPTFTCTGNEPFWSLTVNDSGIYFYELATEKTTIYPNDAYLREGNSYTFGSYTLKKNKIGVEIKEEPCEDDMSGEPFEYSVKINKDGENYSGCCKCNENK